jgi:hypothetical protein
MMLLRLLWAAGVALACWTLAANALTKTRIQDTLFNANGTLAQGLLTIQWNGFTAADGTAVAANSLTLRIVNGVLRTDLIPNPAGTSYTVIFLLDGKRAFTETWVVPASPTPVRVGQVRAAAPAAPGGGGSGGSPNIYTLGGFTGVGPTSFSPGTTWEVYDATPSTGATRQILRAGAGQGTTPLLSFYSGSNFIGLRTPPLGASTTYTLPAQDGLPNSFLRTDGLGNLTWAAPQAAVTGEFYQTFQNEGTSLAQRHNANFLNGLQAADNAGADRTDVSPVYGAAANTVAQGNDSRFPTSSEKAALAGTNGSPSGTNRYVTDSDSRNTNARAPTAHASTHASAGSDPVTPGSIGALKNTSDILNTGAGSNIGLIIRAASGQAASLQEWQDSSGNLLASVTGTGRFFFQEAFFSPRLGETATSLFFQIDNQNRFSMTSFANAWNFNRYDDAGNFKDVAMQFVRNGDTSLNTSLVVNDPNAGAATKLTVKAGAGQGSTNLQEWQSSGGSVLSRIDSSGFFQFPAAQKHGTGAQVQMFTGSSSTDECARFDANGNIVGHGTGCGSGGPLFVDAVTPAGAIDGTNTVFTLPSAPNPAASLIVTRNGLVQKAGTDFNLSGATITFVAAATPQSGDLLVASYRAGTGVGGVLVDTADRGYFFGVSVQPPDNSGTTTTFSSNVHRVWQFVLPFSATVNQISFEVVGTSGAGASLGLGLWDAACSSLVLNSGVMSAGGSPDINVAGVKTKAISGGPVTIPAGIYWLAMTTNSTTLTLRSLALPSQAINLLNGQTNKKFAQAGNNGSSGAFPSGCGTLTTSVSNQPPMVVFER